MQLWPRSIAPTRPRAPAPLASERPVAGEPLPATWAGARPPPPPATSMLEHLGLRPSGRRAQREQEVLGPAVVVAERGLFSGVAEDAARTVNR